MKKVVALAGLTLIVSLSPNALSIGQPGPEKPTLVVFDFPSGFDGGELGMKIGESLRAKALRTGSFVLVDPYSVKEVTEQAGLNPGFQTTPEAVINFVRLHRLARLSVWGDVTKSKGNYLVRVKAVDLVRQEDPLLFERIEVCKTLREIPFASERLVEALLPEPIPEKPPVELGRLQLGPNLVKNGNFEKGGDSPGNWEKVDGLASFWAEEPAPAGRCIIFDTDVYVEEWQAWQKEFRAGTTEPAPTKTPTTGHKYNTVGGTYGAHLYSDYIPVEKGASYVLSLDSKGLSSGDFMFAKVFVKGYGLVGGERREIYRAYKACRTETKGKEWEHFERMFSPTERTPEVKWMRVMLYAHWPPGKYYFDNVRVCKILGEKENDKLHTPVSEAEVETPAEAER